MSDPIAINTSTLTFPATKLTENSLNNIILTNPDIIDRDVYFNIPSSFYIMIGNTKYNNFTFSLKANSVTTFDIFFEPIKITQVDITMFITDVLLDVKNVITLLAEGISNSSSFYDKVQPNVKEYVNYDNPLDAESPKQKQYIDIDNNFIVNPATKDMAKKIDENSVLQSIKNLLLHTPLWYNKGINIYSLVFENTDVPFYNYNINEKIQDYLLEREPRLYYLNVNARIDDFNEKSIIIDISFSLKNNQKVIYQAPVFIKTR